MSEFEVKCPSGAVYKLKRLNYLEKKEVLKLAMKFNLEGGEVKQFTDPFLLLEEALVRSIVTAPWLEPGQKVTKDMLSKITGDDGDALDDKVEEINFRAKGDGRKD